MKRGTDIQTSEQPNQVEGNNVTLLNLYIDKRIRRQVQSVEKIARVTVRVRVKQVY